MSYDSKSVTIDGKKYPARVIGKGAFARALYVPARRLPIVIIVKDEMNDYSKEIMSGVASSNKHLPRIRPLGLLEEGRAYEMPLYGMPLRKNKAPEAWAIYKTLDTVWWETVLRPRTSIGRPPRSGYENMYNFVHEALPGKVPRSVLNALQAIMDEAANYGSEYTFEWDVRNLGYDKHGNLILVDPVYSTEAIAHVREKRLKPNPR